MTALLEHKSTSEEIGPGSVYWRRLTLDPQVSIYLDAARTEFPEIDRVLYDVLRKPAHRQAKGDKAPEDLELRCVAAIVEDPDRYFQRGIIVRLADESEAAARDLWQTAEQIRAAQLAGRFPRNPDSCVQWGRPCDFWAVCTGEATIQDPLLYTDQEDRYTARRLPLLSQSDLRTWRACPRRFYFAHELKRTPRVKAEALTVGRNIHKALEVWWSTRGDVDAAVATLAEPALVDPWGAAKARAMIRCYHARWESDLAKWETVMVERAFIVPLINPETGMKSRTWEIAGRVDAIATEKKGEVAA